MVDHGAKNKKAANKIAASLRKQGYPSVRIWPVYEGRKYKYMVVTKGRKKKKK